MESVGCTYVLIHLCTYVTVTMKEKRSWVWEGRNYMEYIREELEGGGEETSGVTIFQFLKYKLRSAVRMNFTMSQLLGTGENPPQHYRRAGAALS